MIDETSKVMRLADYAGGGADVPNADSGAASIPLLTLAQLREQSKDVTWLVKHAIPSDSMGILFGASGTFKSFIAIDLALHIAHGLAWMGNKTKQGPVLFVAAEGGVGLWRRIVAWHRELRMHWKDAPVYVVPLSVDLGSDAILVRDAATAAGITPALVVVDTLSQTFTGEENSAQEVSTYLREIGLQFRACWQCSVLIVHHTGHVATERPRGSSALRSNVDFMFGVFRDEKEMLATVECVKQKDGDLTKTATFSMKVVELHHDEDGEVVTSLVASEVGQADVVSHMQYEASHGRGGRNKLFLDLAINGIEEKKLRTLFLESVDGDSNTKRQAYFRCRKWATGRGLIEFAEGYVIRLEKT